MMKQFKIILISIILSFFHTTAFTAIEVNANHVILQDHFSGKILFEKDADTRIYPASMTKIMTTIVVFDLLKNGETSLDEMIPVSEKAWRMSTSGYSSMFVMLNDTVSVEDLLKGIIIVSGNDACVALAEGLSGTEKDFVILMNEKAEEIGMEDQTVLKYDTDLQQWYRFMKLPFDVSSATLYDNEIIVTDYSLESRWSLDLETKIAKEYELPKSLFDLSVNNIVEFSIEVGSQGCFHQQKQQKTYSLQDHSFHLQKGDKEFLPTMNQKIKPELLNEIVTAINTSRFQKLSVSDLEVSDNDLANFKKFIDKTNSAKKDLNRPKFK